jgi:hypothetical protein
MISLRLEGDVWSTGVVPLEQVRGERTLPAALLLDPGPLRSLLL